MTTTKFLAAIFAALLLFSGLAYVWRPTKGPEGKIPLTWVSDNNPARTLQIQAFNEENPDLNLSLDYASTGVQKIILQCASGVGPDIFDYNDESLETFVEAGVLMDVSEQAKAMGFDAATAGWPSGYNTFNYLGKQYGFPCNTGAGILIYNKNVFDYFGIPYPQGVMTWDEFIEMAGKVNSPDRNSKHQVFATSGLNWRLFFDSQRGEYFDENGRPRIADSPELYRAFEMHRDFIFKYHLTPTAVETKAMSGQGGWGSGNLNQFAVGRYAMVATGHWSLIAFGRAYQKQAENLKEKGLKEEDIKNPLERPVRLGAILIPHFAGQKPSYRVQSRVAGVNAKSPNRDEAVKFLKYLSGPVYSELLNQGTDWLPGNPKYAELGVEPGPPALAREQLQATTKEAVTYGYVARRSPFILSSDVSRVLNEQISRLESAPSIPIRSLLDTAQRDIDVLLRRNLDRNPELKKLFIEKFGEQAYKDLQ